PFVSEPPRIGRFATPPQGLVRFGPYSYSAAFHRGRNYEPPEKSVNPKRTLNPPLVFNKTLGTATPPKKYPFPLSARPASSNYRAAPTSWPAALLRIAPRLGSGF